jgi:hypothetical protein
MVQGFLQLADSAVDLSTWYTDPEQKACVLNMAVGMGRENALLYDVTILVNRNCSDLLDTSFSYRPVQWGGRVSFEKPPSDRSIGQWWTQEAEPHLTRLYGKFNCLISRANIVGGLFGQAVQQLLCCCEGEWNGEWWDCM